MESLPETKVCTKCEESKPFVEFYKKKDTKDGYMLICKLCSKEKSKSHYKNNRNSELEKARNRRASNPEKVRKSNKESYYRNREARLASMKKYREKNRENFIEYLKMWRAENPEYATEYRAKNIEKRLEYGRLWHKINSEASRAASNRRRARIANASVGKPFTSEDVLNMWGTKCHICDSEIDLNAPRTQGVVGWELGLHEDHVIPLSAGGDHCLENVKPAHAVCNLKKSNKT